MAADTRPRCTRCLDKQPADCGRCGGTGREPRVVTSGPIRGTLDLARLRQEPPAK